MAYRSTIDWQGIESFIGYGRRDAPVVFIGMEEGLASGQSLEDDLIRRSAYGQIIELQGDNRKGQRTWRAMCDLMLRREGVSDLNSRIRNDYQAKRLGRANGDSLLTELLPYPHNKAADWLYASYGRYADRERYLKDMLPKRLKMLQDLLLEVRREIVICYGKAHNQHYRKLFEDAQWQTQKVFEIADLNGTRIVLAPHFSSRAFNTNQQLADLSAAALRTAPPMRASRGLSMEWKSDGSLCPACGSAGRASRRYPAALCQSCVTNLVDETGRKVQVSNGDMWSGVQIRAGETELPEDAPVFANGIECRVREARFGGVVVQPLEVWERPRERIS